MIQKKKFIKNLAKMHNFGRFNAQMALSIFEITQGLTLILFIIIHCEEEKINAPFSSLKQAHRYLTSLSFTTQVLSAIIITLSLLTLAPLIFISRKNTNEELQSQESMKIHPKLIRFSGVFSILFMGCCPIFSFILISNLQNMDPSSLRDHALQVFTLFLCQFTIISCRQNVLFSSGLLPIFCSFLVLPAIFAFSLLILVSIIHYLRDEQQSRIYQLSYMLAAATSLLFLVGEETQSYIGALNYIVLIVSAIFMMLIPRFDEKFLGRNTFQTDNDFILQIVAKFDRDEELTDEQVIRIVGISEAMQLRWKTQLSNKNDLQTDQLLSSYSINRKDLSELFRIKINLQIENDPQNIILLIQRTEVQIMKTNVSMTALYQIEKLNSKMNNRGRFQEVLRMQSLINKAQNKFVKADQRLQISLLIKIEKKLERFYNCVGQGIEQLILLWRTIIQQSLDERDFDQSLSKVIRVQNEALAILNELKQYKDLSLQIGIYNYWRKTTHNISSDNILQKKSVYNNLTEKPLETKFLLFSNNIIEDVSHNIQKQITLDGQDSLIGESINNIFYDFYAKIIKQSLDTFIFSSEKSKLIPFKIIHQNKRFFLCQCSIKIIPFFSQGIKCIINFLQKKEENHRTFMLYCVQSNTIEGFSSSFFQKYKINGNFFPDLITSDQFLDKSFSSLVRQETLIKGHTIKSQLSLSKITKHIKQLSDHHSIPVLLSLLEVYKIKNLSYAMFELVQRDKEVVDLNQMQTFLATRQNDDKTVKKEVIKNKFCRIPNPLQTIIDYKLSRINYFGRLSYFKIIILIALSMAIGFVGVVLFIKNDTDKTGEEFSSYMQIIETTNMLVQNIQHLFFDYFRLYQIKNYPEQILQIQPYNVTKIIQFLQHHTNSQINGLLSLILYNSNPQTYEYLEFTYTNFTVLSDTDTINLVYFLENIKESLVNNQPFFLIKNHELSHQIIDSLQPIDALVLEQFNYRVKTISIVMVSIFFALCLAIKFFHFRISIFKWAIFSTYSQITKSQIRPYTVQLEKIVDLLVRVKHYNKKKKMKNLTYLIDKNSSDQNFEKPESRQDLSDQKKQHQPPLKGIQIQTFFNHITKNMIIFIIPVSTLIFFFIYHQQAVSFAEDCNTILDYSNSLEDLNDVVLDKVTDYYKAAMLDVLPQSQRDLDASQQLLNIVTGLPQNLPNYFNDYKAIQHNTLNYNMCDYAYLNTEDLYFGIDCSKILDGMMNQGFTETYNFLVQQIVENSGVGIQDFGTYFRTASKYPFFMEICYTRKIINNMLAYVQSQFNTAVDGFMISKQKYLQIFSYLGLALLPIWLIMLWFYGRQLRKDCDFAIKCFSILPRSYIMKIGVSKRLQRLGIIDKLQLIAA